MGKRDIHEDRRRVDRMITGNPLSMLSDRFREYRRTGDPRHVLYRPEPYAEEVEAAARAEAAVTAADEAEAYAKKRKTVQTRHRGRAGLVGTSLLGLLGASMSGGSGGYLKSLLGE